MQAPTDMKIVRACDETRIHEHDFIIIQRPKLLDTSKRLARLTITRPKLPSLDNRILIKPKI